MLIKSALRDWLSVSYGMKSITSISHLRWISPLWCLTAPKGGNLLRPPGRLACFPTPAGRLYGFRHQRRYKKWRRRRRTSPAQRYYITPEGESPQPVREASAGPGQNPWHPGPKARRRHQPSRRSRVNLREYWKAPSGPDRAEGALWTRPQGVSIRRLFYNLYSPVLSCIIVF